MNEGTRQPRTAFVSWAHGDEAWMQTIAKFAMELRRLGIDADVDLFHLDTAVDWSTYGPQAIRERDYVIVAASAAYKERWEGRRIAPAGAGVAREANVLKSLFNTSPEEFKNKVVVVVLPGAADDDVPDELEPSVARIRVPAIDADALKGLLRRLTDQPTFVAPPVGEVPILAPEFASPPEDDPPEGGLEAATTGLRERLDALDRRPAETETERQDVVAQRAVARAAIDYLSAAPGLTTSQIFGAETVRTSPRREGPTVVVAGCFMGRRTVSCGLLEVPAVPGIPSARDVRVKRQEVIEQVRTARRGELLLDAVADSLYSVARDLLATDPEARIAAIGVGTPGVVDLATGKLLLSITVPNGTDIPRQIAERLLERDAATVERVFGVDTSGPDDLAQLILVDNDVRCAARYFFSQRGDPNLACLYVGGGVGAGMVVDGHVYYGANAAAGHIGHIDVGGSVLHLSRDRGRRLEPVQCDCGIIGFHFDPMASFSGLHRLAAALATPEIQELLGQLRAAYTEGGMSEIDYEHVAFPRLLIHGHREGSASIPVRVVDLLQNRDDAEKYFETVLTTYTGVLATGISTLAEVVDPGTLVLLGPLIDSLQSDEFDRNLRSQVTQRSFYARAAPSVTVETDSLAALSRGAALRASERGYPGMGGLEQADGD